MSREVFAALRRRANQRGLAIAREEQLLDELNATHDEVAAALDALVEAHLVEVQSPLPFLVVKLRTWRGRSSIARSQSIDFTASRSVALSGVPVSSNAAAAAASSKREDGGAGEGEMLLDEVVEMLGPDADRDEFHTLIARFPAEVVRQALRRVAATPPAQIRKSKAALFRYLLAKLS